MQSILNCLRIAIQNINDFNEEKKTIEITTPDVVSTIYRLIYLSNISIAFQALSLLLQLVLVQDEKHDRYYNALYRKMVDPDVLNTNSKITSLYFHIIHRSIQQDTSVPRAKAFVKRLLQMALSFSPAKACGALIVINKILKSRPELMSLYITKVSTPAKFSQHDAKLDKFDDDSDDEEVYKDVALNENGEEIKVEKLPAAEASASSWIHVDNTKQQKAQAEPSKIQTQYDPFKRAAAYCGAEHSLFYELMLLSRNFHPTVQLFVENVIKSQKIKYFGDPLKDFSLNHFLERFSFKNPKKVDPKEQKSAFHQNYQAKGSRGQSVYLLTAQSCTEDEKFIFDFIQRKREIKEKKEKFKDEKDDDLESVDDDEFDKYLDSLGAAKDFDKQDKEFDYMSELQKDSKLNGVSDKSKKKAKEENDSDEGGDDWGSVEGDSDDSEPELDDEEDDSGTDQSVEENEMSDEGSEGDNESGSEDDKMTSKKAAKSIQKKSKGKDNLFVAVDDFSDLIEQNSSNALTGTLGEIFNKDKSSQKQLDWEQKRRDAAGGFKRKKSFNKKSFGPTKKKFKK